MASKAPAQGKAVAGCNYVAIDQIWKDHVGQEVSATKTWPDNWNFLTTKYEDLVKTSFRTANTPGLGERNCNRK